MKTEVINIKDLTEAQAAVARAHSVLGKGGLVAFPTETVYGLAANADLPQAIELLREIKERPDEKPFTLKIGNRAVQAMYVPDLSLVNRQFLRKVWPGPLTAVFMLGVSQMERIKGTFSEQRRKALFHNNSIGIRLPDDQVSQMMLTTFPSPVVAPSANRAGQDPPVNAEDVLEQLDGKIDLVLNCGTTRYAQASTIVKLEGDSMQVLRRGVLDEEMLRRMRSVTILFVCTGNTCRSPMAEGLCRRKLAEKLSCLVDQLDGKMYKIVSAGVMAFSGSPATPEAVQACRELGVDITGHHSKILTLDLVNQADYIFVMDRPHYQAVLSLNPMAESRTALLGGDQSVSDPIGMQVDGYRKCVQIIKKYVDERVEKLFH